MAGVVVELTGDEAKLLASMQKVIAQNQKTGESFKRTGDESKKASDEAIKEQQRVERESKKAADSIYAAHKKMLDDHARDSRQYALEEEAIARKIAFVEVQEAVKAAEKEIDATEKILNEKKKAAQKESELAQKSKDEISDQIAGFAAVTSVVGGYEAAIQLATKAFQLLSDAKSKALQSQETLSDPNRRLVQVSNSSEDLAAMQKRADDASIATGVSRDVARQVLFSARSEGFENSFEAILASNEVLDPLAASTVAGKVPALFGGKISSMESVSLGLRAAKDSNLNFEQMASSLPTAAEGGALVGASPEELFAVQGVLASRFKSGDTAADRIKAFASSAGIDDRMKGKGIIGSYETIQAMPEDERKDYLGKNQELNAAYTILGEEMPKIQAQLKILQEERKAFADGGGTLREQINIARADTNIQTVSNVRRAQIAEEVIREEKLGSRGGDDAIASAQANTLIEQKDANLLNRMGTTTASFGLSFASGLTPEAKAGLASNVGDTVGNPVGLLTDILNPTGALGNMAAARVLPSNSATQRAGIDIRNRIRSANSAVDQSFAGQQPVDAGIGNLAGEVAESRKIADEQRRLMVEANTLMRQQNEILANAPGGNANAIRQQAQQPRAE